MKIEKNKKLISAVLFSAFVMLIIFPLAAGAAGIVPCGRIAGDGDASNGDETAPCTLCHLIVGIKRIIDYGFWILVFVALVAIVAGGITYVISAGKEELMKKAKAAIFNALVGFGIVLGGWLIINYTMVLLSAIDKNNDGKPDFGLSTTTEWGNFTCSTVSENSSGNSGGQTHTLSVTNNSNSTISGTGIDCGSDCTEANITEGQIITLSSSGASVKWNYGECEPSGSCEITMNADVTVIVDNQ